jgi:hypothetical protein
VRYLDRVRTTAARRVLLLVAMCLSIFQIAGGIAAGDVVVALLGALFLVGAGILLVTSERGVELPSPAWFSSGDGRLNVVGVTVVFLVGATIVTLVYWLVR